MRNRNIITWVAIVMAVAKVSAVTNDVMSKKIYTVTTALKVCSITNSVMSYVVQLGDTVSSIARRNSMTVDMLCAINNKPSDWRLVNPGDTILVMNEISTEKAVVGEGFYQYKVRSGDSLLKIAKERRVSVEELRKWNGWQSGHDKISEGQSIRIAKRQWIDWSNPKLKILYEDYGLPRGNGDDYEVSIDFSSHQVQWRQYTYPGWCEPIEKRKLIRQHTHICEAKCWENVRRMFGDSKCEEWEDYVASDDSICDGGARKLSLLDNERVVLHAKAYNAPIPKGPYMRIIEGSYDGRFCLKAIHSKCKDSDWARAEREDSP